MKKFVFFMMAFISLLAFGANGGDSYKVVDGDSLEQGTRRIRLFGIDAPEYLQNCFDKNGEDYRCGLKSTDYLQSLLVGKVVCHKFSRDRYGRDLCECINGEGLNINRQMVISGWAVAYGEQYEEEEKSARKAHLGIWQGKFMRPELFRALGRAKDKYNKNKKR